MVESDTRYICVDKVLKGILSGFMETSLYCD